MVELPWQVVDSGSDIAPTPFSFTEQVGPTIELSDRRTPFDCFTQVINQSIVESLVEETNK